MPFILHIRYPLLRWHLAILASVISHTRLILKVTRLSIEQGFIFQQAWTSTK